MKVGLAEKTAVLFTKDGDQHNNLFDMQCMWFVLVTFFFQYLYLKIQMFFFSF